MAATASIIIFDQLTEDAAYEFESGNGTTSNTSPPNNWSPHEPRIVVHNDDTIRALFTSWDSTDKYQWNIVSRTSGGTITLEANGKTQDDPFFFRHPASDTAHLIYWAITTPGVDNSVLTLRKSTDTFATGATISSGWQDMSSQSSKHYANAGISLEDGTAVFKTTVNTGSPVVTSNTRSDYVTGTYNSGTGVWTWTSIIQPTVGHRYAYDYMFVNPAGCAEGVYGFPTHDLFYTAAGYATVANGGQWVVLTSGEYVFNGVKQWHSGLTSAANYSESLIGSIPDAAPLTHSNAPTVRVADVYIDSQGRAFIIYQVQRDVTSQFSLGFYLRVNDHTGRQLHSAFITPKIIWNGTGQTQGGCKLYEDSAGRMWILWMQQGTLRTLFYIYPLTEATLPYSRRFGSRRKGPVTTWTIGTGTNLNPDASCLMWEYAADNSALMLAVPRGGNERTMYIDALFNAHYKLFNEFPEGAYDSSSPNNYAGHGQRVFYMRIELPDV